MNSRLLSNSSVKALGAFYTPQTIAEMLAEWAVRAPDDTILEPSAGGGALLRAVLDTSVRKFGTNAGLKIVACDIDSRATSSIRQWLAGKHDVRTGDFLALEPASVGLSRVVIANPPFTRNHAIPMDYRKALRSKFEVEGAAGIWVHFLAHACTFLVPGGRLAAVIPASATFTGYGQRELTRLCERFASVELRTFVDKPVWLNGAEERGAVILAEGYGLGACGEARISSWSTVGLPQAEIHAGNPACFHELYEASVPLGTMATLSIGTVTGCNRVFLLSEQERCDAGIQLDEVVAVASRARQVRGLFVSPEDLITQGKAGEKTWLLAPPDIGRERAGVRTRLASINRATRRSTLWLNKRSPWWKVNHPGQCDAVFTYMNEYGPRLVIAKGAFVCTNTLHRVTFLPAITKLQRISSALTMVSTFGQLAAEREGRAYGGGVLKFELGNARRLPVLPGATIGQTELQRVDKCMRRGDFGEACDLADGILLPDILGGGWESAVREMKSELSMLRGVRTGR